MNIYQSTFVVLGMLLHQYRTHQKYPFKLILNVFHSRKSGDPLNHFYKDTSHSPTEGKKEIRIYLRLNSYQQFFYLHHQYLNNAFYYYYF